MEKNFGKKRRRIMKIIKEKRRKRSQLGVETRGGEMDGGY